MTTPIDNASSSTPPGTEPTEISLEQLALIYGGSGMVGFQPPKPEKPSNRKNTSSGSGGGGDASIVGAPYTPPVEIPNIPSQPIEYFAMDPGPFSMGGDGGGY